MKNNYTYIMCLVSSVQLIMAYYAFSINNIHYALLSFGGFNAYTDFIVKNNKPELYLKPELKLTTGILGHTSIFLSILNLSNKTRH